MNILKNKKYTVLSKIVKFSFVFIFLATLLLPKLFVGAVEPAGTPKAAGTPAASGTPPSTTVDAKIENPLGKDGPQTIQDFIVILIKIILTIGVPILVLALIYAGFLFVKAQGNSEQLETAKRTLLYTVIGGALLLGAFVIGNAIAQTVKDIEQGAM